MAVLEGRVFGGVAVTRAGAPVELGATRNRLVLAALLASPGRRVSIGELVDLVWDCDPPPTAVNQVQRIVGTLRRRFEPELGAREPGRYIGGAGDAYTLVAASWDVDVATFHRLTHEARSCRAQGRMVDAVAHLNGALELAAEPALADLPSPVRDRPRFVAIERERPAAAIMLASFDGEMLDDAAVARILRVADEHRLDERLHAAAIDALVATGRRADAFSLYHSIRERVATELGVDVAPDLRTAYLRALDERPVALPPRRPCPMRP